MVTVTVTTMVLPKRFREVPPTPKKHDSVHPRLDMRTAHKFWGISKTLRVRARCGPTGARQDVLALPRRPRLKRHVRRAPIHRTCRTPRISPIHQIERIVRGHGIFPHYRVDFRHSHGGT